MEFLTQTPIHRWMKVVRHFICWACRMRVLVGYQVVICRCLGYLAWFCNWWLQETNERRGRTPEEDSTRIIELIMDYLLTWPCEGLVFFAFARVLWLLTLKHRWRLRCSCLTRFWFFKSGNCNPSQLLPSGVRVILQLRWQLMKAATKLRWINVFRARNLFALNCVAGTPRN